MNAAVELASLPIDRYLICRARALATGANVHRVNNLTAIYVLMCEIGNELAADAAENKIQAFIVIAQNRRLIEQDTVNYLFCGEGHL